jgi:hypothetical protein
MACSPDTNPARHPHERRQPTLSRDTSPEAEAKQLEIFRAMPPWRKIQLVNDAIKTSYALARAGLRDRHPDADEEEIQRRLFDLLLGEELAERVYGPPNYGRHS